MSESARRTISGHKETIVLPTIAVAAAIMMLYAIPTQQQFAMATVMGPGPITDGDIEQEIEQEIEDVLARLVNLQEEVEDERAKAVLARLINVLEDALARVLPPPPPDGDVEYCYDYRTDTTVETVCYTNQEACEIDRVADPREVISTSCYERQPEN